MTIYLAADHRGFELKEKIKATLVERGLTIHDVGAATLVPDDDYPDHAKTLAMGLTTPGDLGIALCGSGVGIAVALNRHAHIRCGLGLNPAQVTAARRDDNINVLALAADYVTHDQAMAMVDAFLQTQFSDAERHLRRLAKLG